MKTTKELLEESMKRTQELEKQLEEETRAETIKRQLPLRKLAEKAHYLLCNYNHTDGCGWGYEEDKDSEKTWQGFSHAMYLRKVEKCIQENNISLEDLDSFLDELKNIQGRFHQWKRLLLTLN